MKRISTVLLAFLLILNVMLLFISCDKNIDEHTHTFAEAWEHDEVYHWHYATCEHGTEISDKTVHEWGSDDKCTVCQAERAHTHTFAAEWSKDESHHWYSATCGHGTEFINKEEHRWGSDNRCTACCAEKPHTHIFNVVWSADGTHHWYAAVCEHTSEVREKTEHIWGIDNKCTVCQAVKPHAHVFSTEWSKDETYHWYAAICEHSAEVSQKTEHIWGADNKCICGTEKASEIVFEVDENVWQEELDINKFINYSLHIFTQSPSSTSDMIIERDESAKHFIAESVMGQYSIRQEEVTFVLDDESVLYLTRADADSIFLRRYKEVGDWDNFAVNSSIALAEVTPAMNAYSYAIFDDVTDSYILDMSDTDPQKTGEYVIKFENDKLVSMHIETTVSGMPSVIDIFIGNTVISQPFYIDLKVGEDAWKAGLDSNALNQLNNFTITINKVVESQTGPVATLETVKKDGEIIYKENAVSAEYLYDDTVYNFAEAESFVKHDGAYITYVKTEENGLWSFKGTTYATSEEFNTLATEYLRYFFFLKESFLFFNFQDGYQLDYSKTLTFLLDGITFNVSVCDIIFENEKLSKIDLCINGNEQGTEYSYVISLTVNDAELEEPSV